MSSWHLACHLCCVPGEEARPEVHSTPGCSGLRLSERKLLLPEVKGGKVRDGVCPIPGKEEGVGRAQSMGAAFTHLPHLPVQVTLSRGPPGPVSPWSLRCPSPPGYSSLNISVLICTTVCHSTWV